MSADAMKAMGWLAMYALAFAFVPLTPPTSDPQSATPASVQTQAQPERLEKGDL